MKGRQGNNKDEAEEFCEEFAVADVMDLSRALLRGRILSLRRQREAQAKMPEFFSSSDETGELRTEFERMLSVRIGHVEDGTKHCKM